MNLSASKVEPWYLDDIDTALLVYPVQKGGRSVYMKREHYIITMSRQFFKMTSFVEEIGQSKSSFSFKTGGGARSDSGSTAYSSSGKKWMCTKDNPRIMDTVTGEGIQTQVWEYWADEEEMPESEYKVT